MQPFRLLRFRNRIELELLLSLCADCLRTVLAVKGSLRARRNGAPLTAPVRSEQPYLTRGKGGLGKLMAARHLNISPSHALHASSHLHRGRGAGCREFMRLPARGRAFSLDILFYRTGGARINGTVISAMGPPMLAQKASTFLDTRSGRIALRRMAGGMWARVRRKGVLPGYG